MRYDAEHTEVEPTSDVVDGPYADVQWIAAVEFVAPAVAVPMLALVVTVVTIAGPQLFDQSQALITKLPAFADRAARYDRDATFPFENYADLRKAGLLVPGQDVLTADNVGLKLSLLDGRLFATATYFQTASRNDTVTVLLATV